MATNKIMNSRSQQKIDTESNWKLATNFSPLKGELIIYAPDENNQEPRFKVGDGISNVNDLPFVYESKNKTQVQIITWEEND